MLAIQDLMGVQVFQVLRDHEGPLDQLLTKVTQAIQVSLVFLACEVVRAMWDQQVPLDSLAYLDSKVSEVSLVSWGCQVKMGLQGILVTLGRKVEWDIEVSPANQGLQV